MAKEKSIHLFDFNAAILKKKKMTPANDEAFLRKIETMIVCEKKML